MKVSYDWPVIEQCFGKLTDREMADRFDVSCQLIANRRIQKDIPAVSKWSRYLHLLGTMPDKDLAEIMGQRPNTITVYRIRVGIPRFNPGMENEIEAAFCLTLKESYERQVVTLLGRIDILTSSTIYECKYRLGLSELHKAIGQLICFGSIFPDRKKVVVCSKIILPPDAIALLSSIEIEIVQISR